MEGRIYIASAFRNPFKGGCKGYRGELDNDPHIWSEPFTWGICRPDLRNRLNSADYVFFVTPKKSDAPRMIFAYIKISKIVPHDIAYGLLPNKIMRYYKNPTGNILVDKDMKYNKIDGGRHRKKFSKIREKYAISDMEFSKKLTEKEMKNKEMEFKHFLNKLFQAENKSVFEIISRKGRKLNKNQIEQLITWLK